MSSKHNPAGLIGRARDQVIVWLVGTVAVVLGVQWLAGWLAPYTPALLTGAGVLIGLVLLVVVLVGGFVRHR
jgi:hypothetical protein